MKPANLIIYSLIAFCLLFRLLPYRSTFTLPFNFAATDWLYRRYGMIEDWEMYPYAGIIYLTTGRLDTVELGHPPLGKYLFGAAALVFTTPTIVQLPLGLIFLWLIYTLSLKLLKNAFLSCLLSLAVLSQPLFLEQLTHSLLDLFQTTLILLFIYTATSFPSPSLKPKILLGLFLGLMASIKFPLAAAMLALAYFLSLLYHSSLKQALKAWPVLLTACLVYLSLYLPLLLHRGATGLLDLHLKSFKMHLSHVPEYPPLAPLRVMLFNQWPIWWDPQNPLQPTSEWHFTWPFLALAILLSPFFYWKNRKNIKPPLSLIFFFTWIYFIFLNTRLFFPRYLFVTLPFLFFIAFWELRLIKRSFFP